MTLRRKVLTVLLGCSGLVAFSTAATRLALAQFEPPPAEEKSDPSKPKKEDGPVKGFQKPTKKSKISKAEMGKLRLLELQAGARSKKDQSADAATLNGPPLDEREKILQVLNRLSYSPHPTEVEEIMELGGYKNWISYQIDPKSIDDADCDSEIGRKFPWTKMTVQEIKKAYPIGMRAENNPQLRKELPEMIVTRAVKSRRVFQEVMCDFWRNHFCVDQPELNAPTRSWTACDYERNVIRKNVFGKFGQMLADSARHPAMLEYLDNSISKRNAWNENYAREVMELHTMGADRGYTENDVLELSKALTGWTYGPDLKYAFNPGMHQPGVKKWRKMELPEGEKGGQAALTVLVKDKNTAEFISEKLCRYLVNDNPPKELVKKVATKFKNSDGDLTAVYWEIINSPEFFMRGNYRSKFKTPLEFTVSALRNTDAELTDAGGTCALLTKMGEPLYNCNDPTGYFDEAERWMDAGVLTTRWDYAWNLVKGSIPGVKIPDTFFERYDGMSGEEARTVMVDDLIGADLGDRTRKVINDAAEKKDNRRILSVIVGSPDFQQQ